MIVLAIDASADLVSVAVTRDQTPLAERSWRTARPRSEDVPMAVETVLADAGLTLAALDLIAVATGPGSFNGIRGGIATAQGLALALDRPAVGVPTLDAIAYAHIGRASTLVALLPAGRGDYYGAVYAADSATLDRRGAYTVAAPRDILTGVASDALVCGTIRDDAMSVLEHDGLARAPLMAELPRALAVAALAVQRVHEDGFDREASLQPLYLRRPGITRPSGRPAAAGHAGHVPAGDAVTPSGEPSRR